VNSSLVWTILAFSASIYLLQGARYAGPYAEVSVLCAALLFASGLFTAYLYATRYLSARRMARHLKGKST
jgi:hypothetical protein